ncbi:MAG: TRIC cation channel family protein [Atopobiaceae bacterium]|nr:TRIC cation channel family protein [Atopobiaceae bacterium]
MTGTTTLLSLPIWVDFVTLIVGSISGALVGCDRKLDITGVVAMGLLCGLGGGLLRDMIMQVGSVYMLDFPPAIPISVVTGLIVFFFHGLFESFPGTIEWFDIFAVALFCVSGCDKAIVYGLNPAACILMGVLTGVGGGMMRDVFLGETPRIFQRSNLYAITTIIGASVYLALVSFTQLGKVVILVICVTAIVVLRRLSLAYGIVTPADMDLSRKLLHKDDPSDGAADD